MFSNNKLLKNNRFIIIASFLFFVIFLFLIYSFNDYQSLKTNFFKAIPVTSFNKQVKNKFEEIYANGGWGSDGGGSGGGSTIGTIFALLGLTKTLPFTCVSISKNI